MDLSRTRGSGMTAPQPLTYSEITAWANLRPSVHLSEQIVELLVRIDCAFRSVWAEWSKKSQKTED